MQTIRRTCPHQLACYAFAGAADPRPLLAAAAGAPAAGAAACAPAPRRALLSWLPPFPWRRKRARGASDNTAPPQYPARPERFAVGRHEFLDPYSWLRLRAHAAEARQLLLRERRHYDAAAAAWVPARRRILEGIRRHVVSGAPAARPAAAIAT